MEHTAATTDALITLSVELIDGTVFTYDSHVADPQIAKGMAEECFHFHHRCEPIRSVALIRHKDLLAIYDGEWSS